MNAAPALPLSIVHGPPLAQEAGLGALTLPGYLREVTSRYAKREALVIHHHKGTVERWTYSELWERSVAVARALIDCGVAKDSRVGVLMTNRPEWIAAFFGISMTGAVAVALSTFSTRTELEYLLQASCISTLLFERRVLKKDFAELLVELEPSLGHCAAAALTSARLPYLRRLVGLGHTAAIGIQTWAEFLNQARGATTQLVQARIDSIRPADAGALFFSSGSTGKPKGILSTHRGVTIQCWRWRRMLALQDDVRAWSANGFFWSGNFGGALGAALSAGGCVVLQPTFDPAEALNLMQTERVTRAFAWPHQYQQLAEAPNWSSVDLSSLRYVDRRTRLGQHPSVTTSWSESYECYGNTETFTLSAAFPANTPAAVAAGSHGEVLSGNTIKIVDPLTGMTLARGERGEIAVKGPTLMLGYIGVPADETFDSEGFFATGDGGYIDERSRLVWEGRLNDIIKTGGANVSPVEVDDVLATHQGVKLSRTVGVPHETLGEIVVACVVPQEGAQLEELAIREFLKAKLASYKVPRRILTVRQEELMLTGSAKVKLGELRELAIRRFADGT